MALEIQTTVNSASEVTIAWTGATASGTVKVYRTASSVVSPGSHTWTDAETVTTTAKSDAEGAGSVTDYNAVDGYYYTVNDGEDYEETSSGVSTSGYAEEAQADYVPANLNPINKDDTYVAAQNARGSATIKAVNIDGGNYIAIVAIAKTGSAVTESQVAQALSGLVGLNNYQILATGQAVNVTGKQAQLSGYAQIKYV